MNFTDMNLVPKFNYRDKMEDDSQINLRGLTNQWEYKGQRPSTINSNSNMIEKSSENPTSGQPITY